MSVSISAQSRARTFLVGTGNWSGSSGNYTYSCGMPTIADGMNLILICGNTNYITTNGIQASAGAGTITLTAMSKPDALSVLVLPIPEESAAYVVLFPESYSKGQVGDLLSAQFNGMRAYFYSETVDIPNTQPNNGGNPVSINFSSVMPIGVGSPWSAIVWILHNGMYYELPYINSSGVATWVFGISGRNLLIHSTTTWTNAHVYITLLDKA